MTTLYGPTGAPAIPSNASDPRVQDGLELAMMMQWAQKFAPGSYFLLPAQHYILDAKRQGADPGRDPAWVKLATPDEVAASIRPSGDWRRGRFRVGLVAVESVISERVREAVERANSPILRP